MTTFFCINPIPWLYNQNTYYIWINFLMSSLPSDATLISHHDDWESLGICHGNKTTQMREKDVSGHDNDFFKLELCMDLVCVSVIWSLFTMKQ